MYCSGVGGISVESTQNSSYTCSRGHQTDVLLALRPHHSIQQPIMCLVRH